MPVETGRPGLALERVRHAYDGPEVVHDVSFQVAPGEILCLVGPSGCGKTTLLRIAAGLELLQAGRVAIGGRTVAGDGMNVPPEERRVGMLFQDLALFPHLTVAENIGFGLRRLPTLERRRRAEEALRQLDMAGYAETYPHRLSGGQQQRIALARALAPDPAVMLLDEPFAGLDARLRDRLRDETIDVLKHKGVATVIVTHDPEEAMRMADRIVVMEAGRVVQCGRPADLYRRPESAFVAGFLGELNRIDAVALGGAIDTPLGRITASGFADGTNVEILIRPEGLILSLASAADGNPTATVLSARLLGRTSLIRLRLESADSPPLLYQSRMPGDFLPEPGTRVGLRIDPGKVHLFQRSAP